MLKLRSHHICCIFFYAGKGYSNRFVKSMTRIVKHLKKNYNQKVRLVECCDDICKNCPNKINSISCLDGNINKCDNRVCEYFGLKVGKCYSFIELVNKVYKNISKESLSKTCFDCEWYKQNICSADEIEKRLKEWRFIGNV